MYDYAIHQARQAELMRAADEQRLVREAVAARRAARRARTFRRRIPERRVATGTATAQAGHGHGARAAGA